ncbi:MAG TPA: hypothetical protein EYH06_05740 [Chromatiales bacterium]|nr:hypothetical protein [Chromatiales bacterium]
MSGKNILLLGYGEMGHAMEHLLSPTHEIAIWDPYYPGELAKIELEQTATEADFIIFCTPTAALFELAQRLSPQLSSDCICLSMAKSLDASGRTAPVTLQQGLENRVDYAMLYGPMISEEIMIDRPGFAVLAGSSEACLEKTKTLFQGTCLKLKIHNDLHGTAWCVTLKNVYALLFGMADELNLGVNMRGFLAVETLAEMAAIMQYKNGLPETPYTLAGLGDLITTATSEDSHHHQLGRSLARNERDDISGEGINTLSIIRQFKLLKKKHFPLFRLIEKVVQNAKNPEDLLTQYIDEFVSE